MVPERGLIGTNPLLVELELSPLWLLGELVDVGVELDEELSVDVLVGVLDDELLELRLLVLVGVLDELLELDRLDVLVGVELDELLRLDVLVGVLLELLLLSSTL